MACALLSAADRAPLFPAEQTVQLPPLLIDELPDWRYVNGPGFEILSLCDERTTSELARGEERLNHLLNTVLPQSLRVKLDVPTLIVAYNHHSKQTMSRGAVMEMLRDRADRSERAPAGAPKSEAHNFSELKPLRQEVQFISHLRLWDKDQMAILALLPEKDFATATASLTPDYLAFLMNHRTPALPAWFMQGMLSLFPRMSFAGETVKIGVIKWFARPDPYVPISKDPPLLSFAELRKRDDPLVFDNDPYLPPLLPLAQLFASQPSAEDVGLWRAQCTLLVRWMLDPKRMAKMDGLLERKQNPNRQPPISPADVARFIDRSSREKVTEAHFRECFKLSFIEAQERLARYVRPALRNIVELSPDTPIPASAFQPRPATKAEVARIKGELERLEAAYIRPRQPEFAEKYLRQSLRTFQRVTKEKEAHDPRLLASAGLSEAEAGHTAVARELLEAAVLADVVRPHAYYQLACLRLAEARAKPLGIGGKLDVAQTARVLQLLFRAREQSPPLPEVYAMIAETWSQSASVPVREQLAVLDEGVRLFPTNTALVFAAASVNAEAGFHQEALLLADLGQKVASPDEASRSRFARLRASLRAPSSP